MSFTGTSFYDNGVYYKTKHKFPSWFSLSKPQEPKEPPKEIEVEKDVEFVTEKYRRTKVPGCDLWFSISNKSYYGYDATVKFFRLEKVDNPKYKQEYKKYMKAKAKYEERVVLWEEYKKMFDEEQKCIAEEEERLQRLEKYKKLKESAKEYKELEKEFGEV